MVKNSQVKSRASNISSNASFRSERAINEPLLSLADKYPLLFKMKTAALVIIGLAIVILIIDLFLLAYLSTHQPPPQNITFVNDIIVASSLTQSSFQIKNLIKNMLQSDQSTKFTHALLIKNGTGGPDKDAILQIYRNKSSDLLYLMQIDIDGGQSHLIGYFMHGDFPLPDGEDFNEKQTYYTFELQDDRKSIFLSLDSPKFLNLNNSMENTLNCKTYSFDVPNQKMNFLGIFALEVSPDFNNASISSKANISCYSNITTQDGLRSQLSEILNYNITANQTSIDILKYEIYHLS